MTLTVAMKAMLLFIYRANSKNVKRPKLYENLQVHNALLRRGLIREAGDYVELTDEGVDKIKSIWKNEVEFSKKV